ncbi:MAG TPA: hypothetical protein VFA41_02220 [Ktedonobacteraceae bacterium]|jgi:hypothetical protein|nr:hypothetical protein [Ktedonobacteraceae bacterium]
MAAFPDSLPRPGVLASGSSFIGRAGDLQVIQDRLLSAQDAANLSIVGLPKIGKSSLVYSALIEREQELMARSILPLWIRVSEYAQSADLFSGLVRIALEKLRALGWATSAIERVAEEALEEGLPHRESYALTQRFFQRVHQSRQLRILCALDEFDAVENLFRADAMDFTRLHGLFDNPSWRVVFITLSRIPLKELEVRTQASLSSQSRPAPNLHKVFQEHYVSMFSAEDVREFFSRLSASSLSLPQGYEDWMRFYTGNHPYLLALLAQQLFESQPLDVDQAYQRVEDDFLAYFTEIAGAPEEPQPLRVLLQTLTHTNLPVERAEIEKLLKYGLIYSPAPKEYQVFSLRFQAWLDEVEPVAWQFDLEEEEQITSDLSTDFWTIEVEKIEEQPTQPLVAQGSLWPLWRETELTMRHALAAVLEEKYGPDWFESLKRLHPQLNEKDGKTMFDRCHESLQREIRTWGRQAYANPLAYSAPQDLFALLLAEWPTFRDIFGESEAFWRKCSRLLIEVRVLLAHNREGNLREDERLQALDYYHRILKQLQQWRKPEFAESTQEIDLWMLWRETEQLLRDAVSDALEKKYGPQWFQYLEQLYTQQNDTKMLQNWRRLKFVRQREVQIFGLRPFRNYLDFAYPQELFAIIFSAEWEIFSPIFGRDWIYWQPRTTFFSQMRNPLAHHRELAISGEHFLQAVEYCREIQDVLRNYLDS